MASACTDSNPRVDMRDDDTIILVDNNAGEDMSNAIFSILVPDNNSSDSSAYKWQVINRHVTPALDGLAHLSGIVAGAALARAALGPRNAPVKRPSRHQIGPK